MAAVPVRPDCADSAIAADSCSSPALAVIFSHRKFLRADSAVGAQSRGDHRATGLHERLPVNASDGELADLARVFNADACPTGAVVRTASPVHLRRFA